MTCKIDGCGRRPKARGLCENHYYRWRVHGDPLAGRRATAADTDELAAWILSNVVRRPNGCWDWPGARGSGRSGGYGQVKHGGKVHRVHALVCRFFRGPAPDGKPWALHTCDRRICCNPAHLYWGTAKDNARDRDTRGRNGWRTGGQQAARRYAR